MFILFKFAIYFAPYIILKPIQKDERCIHLEYLPPKLCCIADSNNLSSLVFTTPLCMCCINNSIADQIYGLVLFPFKGLSLSARGGLGGVHI